jgi:N12 class adenine-specific DNA methylase
LRPTIRPESAESVEDAFVISMGYRNAVDLSLMGKLLTRENDPDGIREELVARGLAFEDPASGEILPAAKYLSGNLRNKSKWPEPPTNTRWLSLDMRATRRTSKL